MLIAMLLVNALLCSDAKAAQNVAVAICTAYITLIALSRIGTLQSAPLVTASAPAPAPAPAPPPA